MVDIEMILPDWENGLISKLVAYVFSGGALFWFIKNSIKLHPESATTYYLFFGIGLLIGIPLCNLMINSQIAKHT